MCVCHRLNVRNTLHVNSGGARGRWGRPPRAAPLQGRQFRGEKKRSIKHLFIFRNFRIFNPGWQYPLIRHYTLKRMYLEGREGRQCFILRCIQHIYIWHGRTEGNVSFYDALSTFIPGMDGRKEMFYFTTQSTHFTGVGSGGGGGKGGISPPPLFDWGGGGQWYVCAPPTFNPTFLFST